MFIRTLLFLPLLLLRLLLDGEGAGGDAGAAGGSGEGGAAGAGGDKGGGDKGAAPAAGSGATTPPANGDTASGAGAASGGDGGTGAGQDPVARANAQAAAARVKAKEAEDKAKAITDAFAPVLQAMGIETPGGQLDPQKLTQEVESWKGKYRAERVTNTVQRLATELGAKAELTLRYLKGGDELAALDPDDAGFTEAAKAVVQAAIAAEPTLKAAQAAPGASGGDFSAGANGAATSLEKQIQTAAEKGDWKEYNRLMELFAAAKAGQATAGSVN